MSFDAKNRFRPQKRVLSHQVELIIKPTGAGEDKTVDFGLIGNLVNSVVPFPKPKSNYLKIGEPISFKVKDLTEVKIIKPAFYNTPTTTTSNGGYEISMTFEKTDFGLMNLAQLVNETLFPIADDPDLNSDSKESYTEARFQIVERFHYAPQLGKKAFQNTTTFTGFLNNLIDENVEEYIYEDVVFFGYEHSIEGDMAPISESINAFSPLRRKVVIPNNADEDNRDLFLSALHSNLHRNRGPNLK